MENPLHNKENIDQTRAEMLKDADNFGKKSRFGYFSIPYPATVGDRYYAFKSKPHERDDKGKVVTEPRNIQTTIPKWGKSPDVYFTNILKEDPKDIKAKKAAQAAAAKDYLELIHEKKAQKHFQAAFKPSGPQLLQDYFKNTPFLNSTSLYQDPPRKTYVDKTTKKVITENKNILTQPPKKGSSSFPGILFSYPKSKHLKFREFQAQERRRAGSALGAGAPEERFKRPFKPANTALNGFFVSNRAQYAPPESQLQRFKEEFARSQSAGGRKFVKSGREEFASHLRAFFPASGTKSGEKAYFSQRYGVPFVPYIAKKRVMSSKEKGFTMSFKPNLIMNATTFSPTIVLSRQNLKTEFPKIKGL